MKTISIDSSRGVSKPGPPALPLPLFVEEQTDKRNCFNIILWQFNLFCFF